MKVFIALLALFAVGASARLLAEQEYEFLFTNWMRQHGREYKTADEFAYRFQVWKDNMDFIISYNAANHSSTVAMNMFGDLPREEFAKRNGYRPRPANVTRNYVTLPTVGLPAAVDWRAKGGVTPIKNQGQCGSCWAFSAAASTEFANWQATGVLNSFSEQQLMDCSTSYGDQSCEGGLMDDAFQYIEASGITTEAQYPYQGVDESCQTGWTPVGKVTSYTDVTPGDNNALQAASAISVVSVAIEADQSVFQFYSGGIINDPSCGTNLDHGVTLVGYTTNVGSTPYWIVKNSWGTSWGLAGYVYIAINANAANECGINAAASYPTA